MALTTGNIPDARVGGLVLGTAHQQRFFHWPLAFPEVFAAGGFDVIVGNPPFMGGLKISGEFGDKYWNWTSAVRALLRNGRYLCGVLSPGILRSCKPTAQWLWSPRTRLAKATPGARACGNQSDKAGAIFAQRFVKVAWTSQRRSEPRRTTQRGAFTGHCRLDGDAVDLNLIAARLGTRSRTAVA